MDVLRGTIVFMLAAAGCGIWAGCSGSGSSGAVLAAPPLTAPAATAPQAPQAPQPNWFSRTAEVTWDAMQAPVRWVTPKPAPKTAVVPAGPLYEPCEAVIVPRDAGAAVPVLIPERAEPTSAPAGRP